MRLLKEGILERDWDKVITFYELISGESLPPLSDEKDFKQTRETEDDFEDFDAPAEDADESDVPDEEEFNQGGILLPDEKDVEQYAEKSKEKDFIEIDEDDDEGENEGEGVKCRPVPFDKNRIKNNWIDKKNIAVKDIEFDKKVRSKASLEKRDVERRPPAKKIKITCHSCGKKIILEDPMLAPTKHKGTGDRSSFKCDKCITRARGRN